MGSCRFIINHSGSSVLNCFGAASQANIRQLRRLIIIETLRREGSMQMLPLAARIEEACRDAL